MAAAFDAGRALRRLRLRHVELLALLGRVPTVRAAARALSLTQPAVSKMVREIEECFGATLFERSRTGMTPTAAGRHLVARASVLLNDLAAAGEDVALIRSGGSGSVRVGTLSVLPRVPRAIARLRRTHPGIVVRVREGTVVALLGALADGELDAVVGALPPEALQTDTVEALRVEPIADDRLCVMASPGHPLAGARRLGWARLADQPWVLPPKESLLRRALIDAHLRAGVPPPLPAVELLSPISVAELLSLDEGLLGVMRLEQADAAHASGLLRRLPVAPTVALPPIAFITRARPSTAPAALAALRAALAEPRRALSRAAPPAAASRRR